jgi:hypothetical protein
VTQGRALGALFLIIAAVFAGVTIAAFTSGPWPVGLAAAALTLWMLDLMRRAWRRP